MKKTLLLIISLGTAYLGMAQKINGTVKGKLTDTLSKETFSEATVSVLKADSSIAGYGLANGKGEFEIKNLATETAGDIIKKYKNLLVE